MAKRIKLSVIQNNELTTFINSKDSTSEEIKRAQAILLINKNIDCDTIFSITGLSKKYGFKLRKKFLIEGIAVIKSQRKKKSKELLTRQQRTEIIEIVKTKSPKDFDIESDFWTTSILAYYIEEKYKVKYKSKTSIYILFKGAKYSFHKPGKQYQKRDQAKIDQWKIDIEPIVKESFADKNTVILVADEMILSTQTTFQKIWLPQGEYPKIDVSNKRARRCIYGFLNIKTGREHAFKTEFINSKETCKILENIGNLYINKKILIIWDNAPWHKSDEVKTFLSNTRHSFTLKPFPCYAPEENPQEHVWKKGRSEITHNKFIQDVDKAADDFVNFLNNTKFNYKFFDLVAF